ncbi:hypothetical protein [Shewanella frigidimarina]|uniref:hypothetical protein n=1 Tax=Shewanella frigidimarina TaxID=56812 RepID=UPI003D7ACEA8
MQKKRNCVFCGDKPQNKNKEHVLPQWLLKMTGDPKRVVTFGFNYSSEREVRFDWSSFVVPSCESCNSEYSKLEFRAKGYVERLLRREAIKASEYIDFLDWLDKVRVSVWLAYRTLEGNPAGISPNFHVNSRIGKKDRMLAIYSVPGQVEGLNAIGVNTLCFHTSPSVFGLRINNLLIINMSSDYLFSSRCGFPSPKKMELNLDGTDAGLLNLKDFNTTRRVKHPIIRKNIIKPSIHLYQPIMISDDSGFYQSGFLGNFSIDDSYIDRHTLPDKSEGKGILFSQSLDGVKPIYDSSSLIEFECVGGIHSKTTAELMSQVFEFQSYIYEQSVFQAADLKLVKLAERRKKQLIKLNKREVWKLRRVTDW